MNSLGMNLYVILSGIFAAGIADGYLIRKNVGTIHYCISMSITFIFGWLLLPVAIIVSAYGIIKEQRNDEHD